MSDNVIFPQTGKIHPALTGEIFITFVKRATRNPFVMSLL
jgi:hypothetical protein